MLLRFYWGLGVGHTYAHVPAPPRQSQTFTMRENSSSRRSSSSAIPNANGDIAIVEDSDNPDTQDDSDSAVESEDGEGSEEEDSNPESDEDNHVKTMYALYDAGADSGSDW